MDDRRIPPLTGGVLTLFGVGYCPAGATLASLLAVGTWSLLLYLGLTLIISLIFFATLLALATAALVIGRVQGDPREVVVDEFLGMYAALLFLPRADLPAVAALFIAFRLIDILKVPPFSWVERWNSPMAILMDDIAIGLVLGIAYTWVASGRHS